MPLLPLELSFTVKYMKTQVQIPDKLKKNKKVTLINATVLSLT